TCDLRIRSPLLYPAELQAQLRNHKLFSTLYHLDFFGKYESMG
ncbi:uncharacterized protein METZ01_LOCUS248044, partial [marine metagenome]